ncbi:hypothetical protein COT72_00700 [archaeon CG10_big_fil_rev_8_21_14_0_10_43_11]|nr:MAG: hypothetical protein COT72_00700 [archaeon CG10_big_fil_rev_8_21_14_0_10_43_11]
MVVIALTFFSIAFILGMIFMPYLIKHLLEKGFFGFDVHKRQKVKVAEPGGFGVVFSFMFTILLYVAFLTFTNSVLKVNLLAATLTILMAGIIGVIDDMLALPWRVKLVSAFIPALPLIALKAGTSSMIFPLIGSVELGLFYSLVMIPLMVNFAINSYNMLAGFNGLESGMAIISLATVALAALKVGNTDVMVLAASGLGATLAFYIFNRYPSRVFPGDTGTFVWGALLISALIIGNMEKLAIGIFSLYFVNFFLFMFYLFSRSKQKFAKVGIHGDINPPSWYTLYWVFPYFIKGLKEKHVVAILLGLQVIICAISLVVFV